MVQETCLARLPQHPIPANMRCLLMNAASFIFAPIVTSVKTVRLARLVVARACPDVFSESTEAGRISSIGASRCIEAEQHT